MRSGFWVHSFILLILASCFQACTDQPLAPPGFDINRLYTLQTYALDSSFRLEFYGNNYETGFVGYNVYISRSNTYSLIPRLYKGSNYASLPFQSIDPSVKQVAIISKDCNGAPLTNGRKYYVWMEATNILNGNSKASLPSPISLVTPLTEYDLILSNHAVSGTGQDAIQIDSFAVPTLTDAPDLVPVATISFFFELKLNNNQALPYLCTRSNEVYIQDLGTFQDISYLKNLPVWPQGWIGPESGVLAVQNHIVGVYCKKYDFYGKVFFDAVPSPQPVTTTPVLIRIHLMIQKNSGLPSF